MQNIYGKSVFAPYSVRPKPGAIVSAPFESREIEKKRIAVEDFTIKNITRRIKKKGELFKEVLSEKQSPDKAFKKMKAK